MKYKIYNPLNKAEYKMRFIVTLLFIAGLSGFCSGQKTTEQDYKVACIGFYNLENLFDVVNDTTINDDEFLPTGSKNYTEETFRDKLTNLSTVISQLGSDITHDGLAILGVSEVENRFVLEQLVQQKKIKERNYHIIHYDSPDKRGIDVALLYNPKYFKEIESEPMHVPLKNPDGSYYPTRDILWVFGLFKGEPMHFFVCHWPSRRGGEEASAPGRKLAADIARTKIDSINKVYPDAKIMVMGDLNDDPLSPSVVENLKTSSDENGLAEDYLYNPWVSYYKKGIGTLAWNDSWNLFDQILISKPYLEKNQTGFFFHKAVIFNKPYLVQTSGRYKGYPLRTYDFNNYMRGYSDHFPVYVVLLKKD